MNPRPFGPEPRERGFEKSVDFKITRLLQVDEEEFAVFLFVCFLTLVAIRIASLSTLIKGVSCHTDSNVDDHLLKSRLFCD